MPERATVFPNSLGILLESDQEVVLLREPVEVLLVEDKEEEVKALIRAFEPVGESFQVRVAPTVAAAYEYLRETTPELVIADSSLPDGGGTDLLLVDRRPLPCPVLVMTKHGADEMAVETMSARTFDRVARSDATFADLPRIAERALKEWNNVPVQEPAEEQVYEQHEFVRSVLESLTHPFYVVDVTDYTVLMANSAARSGASSGANTCYSLVLGRSEPCNTVEHPCPLPLVKKTKKPTTVEHLHHDTDGRARHVEVHAYPIVDREGNVTHVIEYTLDVTDRRQVEAGLKRSEECLRNLIESSPMGVTIVRNGRFEYVNPKALELFGYDSADEILQRGLEALVPSVSGESSAENVTESPDTGDVHAPRELRGLKKNGQPFDICVWMAQTEFHGERAVLNFVADCSQEKSMREQLFRAQKMESLGTLASGIAHDFNNVLTIVQGYSELLLEDRTERDPAYEDIRKIATAAENGAELVQRILMFSRKGESEIQPICLNDEIRRAKELLDRTIPKMIEIKLRLEKNLQNINADPGQVEQVLLNLAVNAQHAMPEGGTLTIETQHVVLDEAYSKTYFDAKPGEYVLLTVSDTGHGMVKEVLDHIFEPFFTTKGPGEGTGLGLAMVYGVVKSHGGRILCYSEPGIGTTFKIYFPVAEVEQEPDLTTSAERPLFGTETILLVDDDHSVLSLGERILSGAGYTVMTASDGKQALDRYLEAKDKISLVILDLSMPRMGGGECLSELVKIDPRAKVLITSGYSAERLAQGGLNVQAEEFIGKPYRTTQMLRKIRDLLDKDSPIA